MTRAMGHSPNGQDPKGLGAKPEWPGLANGEMRPALVAMTNLTQRNLSMKPLPESSMDQHTMFIHALCQDWLEAGTVTRTTPRAYRILEISRQVLAMPQAARADRASTEPQSPLRLVPSGDHRLSQGDA